MSTFCRQRHTSLRLVARSQNRRRLCWWFNFSVRRGPFRCAYVMRVSGLPMIAAQSFAARDLPTGPSGSQRVGRCKSACANERGASSAVAARPTIDDRPCASRSSRRA